MGALQEFSKLFKELEDNVIALKKDETSIAQSIKTLESRKRFLEESIEQADERRRQQEARHDQVLLAEGVELDIVKSAQDEARKELEKVNAEIEASQLIQQQNLENLQARTDDLNAEALKKQQAITELQAEYSRSEEVLDEYKEQFQEKDGQLAELDAKINNKRVEVDQAYSALNTEQGVVEGRLKTLNDKLDTIGEHIIDAENDLAAKQKELDRANVQLNEFKDYEERAKKALESREASLIAREQALGEQEITNRRRNSVLDNL